MMYDLIRLRALPSVKIGRRRLIAARTLVEYVNRMLPCEDADEEMPVS